MIIFFSCCLCLFINCCLFYILSIIVDLLSSFLIFIAFSHTSIHSFSFVITLNLVISISIEAFIEFLYVLFSIISYHFPILLNLLSTSYQPIFAAQSVYYSFRSPLSVTINLYQLQANYLQVRLVAHFSIVHSLWLLLFASLGSI